MYNHATIANLRPGANGNEVVKMHAVSRIMLHKYINNIQVSWVKEGKRMSQILLRAGVNDFGGSLSTKVSLRRLVHDMDSYWSQEKYDQ